MLKLKFATNNTAFDTDDNEEAARILRAIADNLTSEPNMVSWAGVVRDVNGNAIGQLNYESNRTETRQRNEVNR